jgi:hypothetical protein
MKEEPVLQMGTDSVMLRNVYDKSFTSRISDRDDWKDGFQPD